MNSALRLPVAALALAALFPGCQSPRASRLQENAALIASLDPVARAVVQNGFIDIGFTAQLVQISLGKPDTVQAGDSAQGRMETWTYKNFVYGETIAAKVGMNNPGTKFQGGSMVSPNAPSSQGGTPSPSLGSTKPTGPQPGVGDLADTATGTLFVDLLEGRVFSIRLDR
jgi:hypothetical protein